MTRQSQLRAINCTSCGAGLEIIGGGRVTTHVCGYCGSALDALENYRILKRFANIRRPETPFKLGMEGKLWNVPYRVIGIIENQERDEGRTWTWIDHLLFSETHGYAWLTIEDGRLTWSRRYRKSVAPAWVYPEQAESALRKPVVTTDGERFTFYETSTSRITFVEGEFTWRPFVGDESRTTSFKSATKMLHFIEQANEREIEISGHLSLDKTLTAFGVRPKVQERRDAARARATSVADDEPADHSGFIIGASIFFATACLVGALVLWGGGHTVLPQRTILSSDLPTTVTIPVDEPGRLVQLDVEGQVSSGWAWIEFELEDPNDQPVFIAGREVGYYTGRDADGAWTENDRRTRLVFRPEMAGDYTLEVAIDEAGLGEGDTPDGPIPAVTVAATDGKGSPFWLLLAGMIFAALAAWKIHERQD